MMHRAVPSESPRPTIVLVSTRELSRRSMAGRYDVAYAIHTVLNECSNLLVLRLPNVLTEITVSRLANTAFGWLKGLLIGPALPFQCALFANSVDHRRLLDAIPDDVTSVYLDGVRCYGFLVRLRRERPDLRIVVDFDDLMSRRMALLLQARQSLSPGYLTLRLPKVLQRLMSSPFIGRAIVRYERSALTRVERRVAALADSIVFLSSEDAKVFTAQLGRPLRASIEVIAPPTGPVVQSRPFVAPSRFVFVGSETQTQNRLTINYLKELWRRYDITTPLVLVGYRWRDTPLPPNVTAAGYMEELSDVYDGRSVLLTPSFIGGGIKTKVLEAFAHGAPVIGNPLTFEAMALDDYPLNVTEEQALVELIRHPDRHRETFARAAVVGGDYIRKFHDPGTFGARWRALMCAPTPSERGAAADVPTVA
jgi:glycosyltransferase involved in cell wall biosynthesis